MDNRGSELPDKSLDKSENEQSSQMVVVTALGNAFAMRGDER
jgi:hypothetical protein